MDYLIHDGAVPVDEDTVRVWQARGIKRVRINFVADLMDLIEARDMNEWNNFVDEMVGVSLVDLSYGVAKPDPDDKYGEGDLLLWVEGDLDESLL